MSFRLLACVIAGSLAMAATANAATFSFAGYSFDQDDTPDVLSLLGNGATIGGAAFSSGGPSSITSSVGFPSGSVAGFDPAKSLGRQANAQAGVTQGDGTSCTGACAVNLPSGNNGTSTRHGLEASWSGGLGVMNGAGDDIVIYESASSSTGDEGFMVRMGTATGLFSDWRYETFDVYEAYTGGGGGAMSTAFDISDFGFGGSEVVSVVQIANMISSDTISSVGGGFVLFDGSGFAPGFGSSELDPDPLYIGVLSGLGTGTTPVPVPAALPMMLGALCAFAFIRRNRRN